ncbi:hypothetical protein CHUAL_001808 [Chamberlinius hualienensis]
MVFQEVIAILTPDLFRLCTKPDDVLTKLSTEVDEIKTERVDTDDGNLHYIVRGSLDQIVLCKLKLEKMMPVADHLKTIHDSNLDSSNLHSVVQRIAKVKTNGTEPTEIMPQSKHIVKTYSKVSPDVSIVQTETEEDEKGCEDQKHDLEMEVSPHFSSDHSEVSDSPVLEDSVDIKTGNFMHLEEVAEKKSEKWFSISDIVTDTNQLDDLKPTTVRNASTIFVCGQCSYKAEKEGPFLKHVLSHGKTKKRKIQFRFNPRKDIDVLTSTLAYRPWELGSEIWEDVAKKLQDELGYDVTSRTCRLRVEMLIRQYKKQDMIGLRKSGTEEEYGQREALLQEIVDQMGSQDAEETQLGNSALQDISQDFVTISPNDSQDASEMYLTPKVYASTFSESRKRILDRAENDEEREKAANDVDIFKEKRRQKVNFKYLDEKLKIEKEKLGTIKGNKRQEVELEEKIVALKMMKTEVEQERIQQNAGVMKMMATMMEMMNTFLNK